MSLSEDLRPAKAAFEKMTRQLTFRFACMMVAFVFVGYLILK
ncbi:hypothetical protein J2Y48_000472 [Mycoplana sp. BE70]|nr:hypothetical protein [Mycoplana sp. BE70]